MAGVTVVQVWEAYRRARTVDPVTMSGYESLFAQHVGPVVGDRPVAALDASAVAGVLSGVEARGLSPSTVRLCRVVLSAVCRHALQLGVIEHLPTAGVEALRGAPRPPRVMTPGEYVRVRDQLPTSGAKLLADVLVCTGVRTGEALALMPEALAGDRIDVQRALTEPGRRFTADGARYVLRPSTKNGERRSVLVGVRLVERLQAWCESRDVARGALVFPARGVAPEPSGRAFPRKIYTEPLTRERVEGLGSFSGPNGLTYWHGTMNGYVTGRCRSACCRQAISEYSAARKRQRRLEQGGAPRRSPLGPAPVEGVDAVGAMDPLGPREWGRLWRSAAEVADLGFVPLARETRHAHASWLNSGGASVERIADRLGHRDERSTRWYVRPVGEEADPVAVIDALLQGVAAPSDEDGRSIL